jgi:hypothetical protein
MPEFNKIEIAASIGDVQALYKEGEFLYQTQLNMMHAKALTPEVVEAAAQSNCRVWHRLSDTAKEHYRDDARGIIDTVFELLRNPPQQPEEENGSQPDLAHH